MGLIGLICPIELIGLDATVKFIVDCDLVSSGWAKAIQSKVMSTDEVALIWMLKPSGVLVATP